MRRTQETGRVVKHIESWDVQPGKVLLQLVKPANKSPANKTEAFMLGLSRGDVKSMWLASDDLALYSSLPLVALAIFTRSFTGHGLPVSPECCHEKSSRNYPCVAAGNGPAPLFLHGHGLIVLQRCCPF
jgi:hypothetical protein